MSRVTEAPPPRPAHVYLQAIRLALQHIDEPTAPPSVHPPRGTPDEAFANQTVCLDEDVNQDRYEFEPDQRLSW
jgi:hypothetical protein